MPKKEEKPPQATANALSVQHDLNQREFLQNVQLGVSQIASFLNDFGARAWCDALCVSFSSVA